MNEKFEKYIEDLSPEMQEKARACKTPEELNAFIAENDIEIPEEALDMVSGGCNTVKEAKPILKCNYCNSVLEKLPDNQNIIDKIKEKLQTVKSAKENLMYCRTCNRVIFPDEWHY